METLKMIEKKKNLQWDYDAEADVLYISIGKPVKAESIDIGKGTIVRVDPESNEIVGFTIISPLKRTLEELKVGTE
ncbi:DUF2283 domain-containing protein [Calditrichota bacterium LG25]